MRELEKHIEQSGATKADKEAFVVIFGNRFNAWELSVTPNWGAQASVASCSHSRRAAHTARCHSFGRDLIISDERLLRLAHVCLLLFSSRLNERADLSTALAARDPRNHRGILQRMLHSDSYVACDIRHM